jgi:hypothetical protein
MPATAVSRQPDKKAEDIDPEAYVEAAKLPGAEIKAGDVGRTKEQLVDISERQQGIPEEAVKSKRAPTAEELQVIDEIVKNKKLQPVGTEVIEAMKVLGPEEASEKFKALLDKLNTDDGPKFNAESLVEDLRNIQKAKNSEI